ncbi:MAG: magnesium transporter [Phycisphaerae bacterium]|nr:magnesium transporter [Phycisphaerae bacterium]HAW95803.1 magnesium transporter [Phycisphaerales bacterium]
MTIQSRNQDPNDEEPLPSPTIDDPTSLSEEDLRVAALLQGPTDLDTLASAVEAQEAADAADTLETLEESEAAGLLETMDIESASEALSEMLRPLGLGVFEDLIKENSEYAGSILEAMAPDDATDFLQGILPSMRDRLLAEMSAARSNLLRGLLAYDEESAGGLMTTDFLAVRDGMTVSDATDAIRRSVVDGDVQFAFVTDWDGRLRGVLSLRRLLLASPDDIVGDICNRDVSAVSPDLDREAVALEFEKYDFLALPVIDDRDHLLGVVEVDDVIEIIRAVTAEDAQLMVGAGAEEAVYSNAYEKLRGRLPWLIVNLVTSSLAALVVLQFDDLIAEIAILAVLMPVIANQSGNAGQQSLAVTLRGIVLDQIRPRDSRRLILREGLVGLVNGLIAGVFVGLAVTAIGMVSGRVDWRLGVVAGVAMTCALAIGTISGATLPLLMKRLGADPATASTIFLTMITDSMSFLVFLGLATALQGWLL